MNLRETTVVRAYEILREFVFSTKSERMCLGAENICIDPMVLYENRRKDFNKRVTEIVTLITRYYENSLPIIRRIDELYVKNVLPNFKKTA